MPPSAFDFWDAPVYKLYLPNTATWQPEQALHFTEALLSVFSQVALQISADYEGILWRIIDLSGRKQHIDPAILKAYYPDMTVVPFRFRHVARKQPLNYLHAQYKLRETWQNPVLFVTDMGKVDALASIVQAMSYLNQGEAVFYTLIISGKYFSPVNELFNVWDILDSASSRVIEQGQWGGQSEANLIRSSKREAQKYECFFFLTFSTPTSLNAANRINTLYEMMTPHLKNFDRNLPNHPHNGFQLHRREGPYTLAPEKENIDMRNVLHWYEQILNRIKVNNKKEAEGALFLEPRELAALWHPPHRGFEQAKVTWAEKVVEVPDFIARNSQGVRLGEGIIRGKKVDVHILPKDRNTHLNILGKVGMGKSTLMHHLIHQDIASGAGVAVIDPHGTLIRDILRMSIPSAREQDVVLIDLDNATNPPPLNPLRGMHTAVGVGRVSRIIETLFAGTEQLVRVSKYLNAALVTLQVDEQPTIRDLSRLFTHPDYRNSLVDKLDEFQHAQALDVWDAYEALNPREQDQISEFILSRISPFYNKGDLYLTMCHPDAIDFRQHVEEGKIILISLKMSDDKVSQPERDLVGALLVSTLQMGGMESYKKPFYIYIDEVQRFVTTSLSVMLAEARKFGLSLTIAHQYFDQLKGVTLDAVRGTTGATICFRCGVDDARAFAPQVSPEVDARDLMNLDKFQAIVKMQHDEKTQPAFSLFTSAPLQEPANADVQEQRLCSLSNQRYTPKTVEQVKDWLRKRYPRRGKLGTDHDDPNFG